MKKFALLVLIATTVSYCAEPGGKSADTNAQRKQTELTRTLQSVDTTHKVAGFFAIASFGNLFKSRPLIAIPLCILSAWQAFIPKAPNTPQLRDTIYNMCSICTSWGNRISRNINQYRVRLQKEDADTQKQPQQTPPTTSIKNSDQ